MIEVNLMPPGASGPAREGDAARSRTASPWHMAACVPGMAGLVALALLHPGIRERRQVVDARLAQALRDSTELAGLISVSERLRAGRDSAASRMRIIEELDRRRYSWPRILDDVAGAVPEFTWLTRIAQGGAAEDLHVEIEGRAGNTFALTRFMNRLEASPFLATVDLVTTEQIAERLPGGGEWVLNAFVLRVGYHAPPESTGELPGDDLGEDIGSSEAAPS